MVKAPAKDFSQSAENLCNPEEVKGLLEALHSGQLELADLEAKLREQSTELVEAIAAKQGEIAAIEQDLKGDSKQDIVGAIEKYGSYQDTEALMYAVKYRRMIKSYHPEPLKKHFPKFAELCIQEAVNVPALTGQVKGNLLTEDELKKKGVITEEASYAYYVR